MVSDPETLRAKAEQYRQKAAELRLRAKTLRVETGRDFRGIAADYEELANQLDALARDAR